MSRTAIALAAAIGLILVSTAGATHLISTDGAIRVGPAADLDWWGTYIVSDAHVVNVYGEYKRVGAATWLPPILASWGGGSWDAYTPTTIAVGNAAVRALLISTDPNGDQFSDVSNVIGGV